LTYAIQSNIDKYLVVLYITGLLGGDTGHDIVMNSLERNTGGYRAKQSGSPEDQAISPTERKLKIPEAACLGNLGVKIYIAIY